jgi:glutamate/tyrosine decarboxylase-like PLP-dependent enzyme
VVANAGTTNTGTIDPLESIHSFCESEGLWSHVDAAYGGFAALSPRIRPRLAAMQRADSLTLDPHKWMYTGMGIGCVFVRDERWMQATFTAEGGYLRDVGRDQLNFFDRGPELSRPARVLSAWMVLKCAGLDELRRQVEWDLDLAALAADRIDEDPRLEVVCRPELSTFAFRHTALEGESEEARGRRDAQLVQRVLDDGGLLVSSTHLHGRSAVRFVVMNHRSSEAEVLRSVARLRELVVEEPA